MNAHDRAAAGSHERAVERADPPEDALIRAMTGSNAEHLVANTNCVMRRLEVDRSSMPVSISRPGFEGRNSYVCSPYGALITYSLDELRLVGKPALQAALGLLIRGFGLVMRLCEADRVVGMNNWLLSTNPTNDWRADNLLRAAETLETAFPNHYLLLRSLNAFEHGRTIEGLVEAGWHAIPMRQVYYLDLDPATLKRAKNLRRDVNLARRTRYTPVRHGDFSSTDLARCAALYGGANRVRHSLQNPAFTEAFVRLCYASGVFSFSGWRHPAGDLSAFSIMHLDAGTATIPFMGYDVEVPRDDGLYRLFFVGLIQSAQDRGAARINCGAGAGAFKTSRGGRPHTEYMLVYDRHLAFHRRHHYRLVAALMRRLAVPLMLKYGL